MAGRIPARTIGEIARAFPQHNIQLGDSDENNTILVRRPGSSRQARRTGQAKLDVSANENARAEGSQSTDQTYSIFNGFGPESLANFLRAQFKSEFAGENGKGVLRETLFHQTVTTVDPKHVEQNWKTGNRLTGHSAATDSVNDDSHSFLAVTNAWISDRHSLPEADGTGSLHRHECAAHSTPRSRTASFEQHTHIERSARREASKLDTDQELVKSAQLNGIGSHSPHSRKFEWKAAPKPQESSASGMTAYASVSARNHTANVSTRDFNLIDYHAMVPEDLPQHRSEPLNKKVKDTHWTQTTENNTATICSAQESINFDTISRLDPTGHDAYRAFHRISSPAMIPARPHDPPELAPPFYPRDGFPVEFWDLIPWYLSSQELRNLRLVNKKTARELAPYVFRTSVVNFGPGFFNIAEDDIKRNATHQTVNLMLKKYGRDINKFGISFEYDLAGLASAPSKAIQEPVNSWFGDYVWPVENYPRFSPLERLEDLTDEEGTLLRDGLKYLTKVSELGLSIDSGHGWLAGPDSSDLALWRMRLDGSKVFGRVYDAPDKLYEHALRQYFRWAQQNTLNANIKAIASSTEQVAVAERQFLQRISVRDYDEYRYEKEQPDFNRLSHIGMLPSKVESFLPTLDKLVITPREKVEDPTTTNNPEDVPHVDASGPSISLPRTIHGHLSETTPSTSATRPLLTANTDISSMLKPQWPLIFDCYNLAAQVGGERRHIQSRIARLDKCPLLPGILSEAQAQWLMETLWAQRSFLAAYTNSVIINRELLKNVHSLHIAKISSNLLPSLEQEEFWKSLPNLKHITLLVVPDWRREHVPGDKFFNQNMALNPVKASIKLANILNGYITQLENVSSLTTGFVDGGEHATGIRARNNHVLPAPVTFDPLTWLKDGDKRPDGTSMFVFNHIRNLTFQNCWFSPQMLESFVRKSRDTSLHNLVLDSVSLTGKHKPRVDGAMMAEEEDLECAFDPTAWLLEEITEDYCWVSTLEKIVPGKTILDQRYQAGYVDEKKQPRPPPRFRGNVETIMLKSCGYVQIGGMDQSEFAQHGLFLQSHYSDAFDDGLRWRQLNMSATLPVRTTSSTTSGRSEDSDSDSDTGTTPLREDVMLRTYDPRTGKTYAGLGQLTSCIHPVEKKVLEQAWSLHFGWGDSMERWAAVEDGHPEGGTGRFSGIISKYSTKSDRTTLEPFDSP